MNMYKIEAFRKCWREHFNIFYENSGKADKFFLSWVSLSLFLVLDAVRLQSQRFNLGSVLVLEGLHSG